MSKQYTVKDIVDGLNEAMDLLSVAGPNRILVDEKEYFERLGALQDKFAFSSEKEE